MNYNSSVSLDIKISYICKNEYNYFLNKEGVVGVALGYKITKGFSTFRKCITVFVHKKISSNNLIKENIVPKYYKGIVTDVVESGPFSFHSLSSRVRPVLNGYSIGNILRDSAGSCGCLVSDKDIYILSCNHILALNNTAPLESAIVQPGVADGGTIAKDVIGHLGRFIPIKYIEGSKQPKNLVDCAICKVTNRFFVSPSIALVGLPQGIANPRLNEDVKKVGRSTELTYGKIKHLYASILLNSPAIQKKALFINQIVTTSMDAPGDSGSVLLNNKNYVIGLCISGNDQTTAYTPIDTVLNSLNVKLVTN